jgi:hypothetical protein
LAFPFSQKLFSFLLFCFLDRSLVLLATILLWKSTSTHFLTNSNLCVLFCSCERARASAVATLCRLFCPRLSHFPFSFASFSSLSAKFSQQSLGVSDSENLFESSVTSFASRFDISSGSGSGSINLVGSNEQAALTIGRDPLSDRDVDWVHKFIFMVGKVSHVNFFIRSSHSFFIPLYWFVSLF